MNNEAKETYNQLLKLKNYSQNTIKSYTHCFWIFTEDFKTVNIDNLTNEQISNFLYKESLKGLSYGYQNQIINAIKFYYEKVLGKKRNSTTYPEQRDLKNYQQFSAKMRSLN
jgi:integrase/recombinase XerD